MALLIVMVLVVCGLFPTVDVSADDVPAERLLRSKAFNRVFEGFDYYTVTIEEDRPHIDGSREVVAAASGTFLQHAKRMKVLFLIVGEEILGGQVLEGTDLPPCVDSTVPAPSSL